MILEISNLTVSSRSVFEPNASHTISKQCRHTGLKYDGSYVIHILISKQMNNLKYCFNGKHSRFLYKKQGVIFQSEQIFKHTNLSQSNDIVTEILKHEQS